MTTTTTRSGLPPALMSWIEHTSTARQKGITASAIPTTERPAFPPTVRPLAAEPVTHTTDPFPPGTVLLKALLRRAHWQSYDRFCRQYDKAAATIDRSLIGTYPSRPQHYRWLSGQMTKLPHPHHCEVLEAMFPGYTAEQLMAVIR